MLEQSMYPIFVFEGPDGAGKTSLAEELKKYVGARYIHLTYRWTDKMNLYHAAAIRYAARLAETQPVIIDRWWPSEIIYAEAYRGGSSFIKHYFMLEHIATQLGVTYVWCQPEDRERYLAHYDVLRNTRDEMYESGMSKVYDGYADFYKNYMAYKENVATYDLFKNFNKDEASREMVMRSICQKLLEFSEDNRR